MSMERGSAAGFPSQRSEVAAYDLVGEAAPRAFELELYQVGLLCIDVSEGKLMEQVVVLRSQPERLHRFSVEDDLNCSADIRRAEL